MCISIPEEVKGSLCEVTETQLISMRMRGQKGIVVKCDDKLYLVQPNAVRDFQKYIFGSHKCATCQNLSGVKCQKVYDMTKEYYRSKWDEYDSTVESKRIEKYPFIHAGVERFNYGNEYFIVAECDNYEAVQPQKSEGLDSSKVVGLAQFLWPDVENMGQVKERCQRAIYL